MEVMPITYFPTVKKTCSLIIFYVLFLVLSLLRHYHWPSRHLLCTDDYYFYFKWKIGQIYLLRFIFQGYLSPELFMYIVIIKIKFIKHKNILIVNTQLKEEIVLYELIFYI